MGTGYVEYIGKNGNPRTHKMRNAIIAGGLVLAAAGAVISYAGRRKMEVPIGTIKVDEEKIDYPKLADIVISGLESHPEYADRFIFSGIEALAKTGSHPDANTYILMFNVIKDKTEEKPEILDYLGENAQAYMEKKVTGKYLFIIQDTFDSVAVAIKEKGAPVLDALMNAKDSVIKSLGGK
jgi:hypothetical protein